MSSDSAPSAGAIVTLLVVLLIALLLGLDHLARPWVVVGSSMEPTLRGGDRVLVDLWTYRQRPPRRGEVVVVRPDPASSALVKRVTRIVPGPPGHDASLWLVGDNARDSLDSRQLGAIERDRIVGRVVLRLWPPRIP